MAELDHLVFVSPDLELGVEWIAERFGVGAVVGGSHQGLGTKNALLGINHTTYFEVIGIDPDQPEPDGPRPFGVDKANGLKLAAYAVHPTGNETIEDVVANMSRLGIDPGEIVAMSRLKPDGSELRWRLTFRSDPSSSATEGLVPFVIDWGRTLSPALELASMGELASLTVTHPSAKVRNAITSLNLAVDVVDGDPGLSAVFETQRGSVEVH